MAKKGFAAVVVSAGLVIPASGHEGDILVGRDIFTNELELGFVWETTQLVDFLMPQLPGWWNNDILLEEDDSGNPRTDRIPIDPGSEIVMIFENWHPAVSMYPDGDLGNVYEQDGQELFLGVGGTAFATRSWWRVDSTDPEYDPNQLVYTVDIRVIDRTGTHLPSVTYTLMLEIDDSACVVDMTGSGDPNNPDYGVPNGALDVDDFFYFLDRFAAGDREADLTGSSDPNDPRYGNPDGAIDADDFFYFLDIFSGGCRVV